MSNKIVLSSWAFNQNIPTPLTNEIPHLSVFDLLNANLKTRWVQEYVGKVKTYYEDYESIKRMGPHILDDRFAKPSADSPYRSANYKAQEFIYTDYQTGLLKKAIKEKINMDISGSYETEMDYLMHEGVRYLGKLFPDNYNSLLTLTEAERQSYFNEALHMVHSYFDTYQIQSGDETVDFYLRYKFLTNITPIRSLTGTNKQEQSLINILQTHSNSNDAFTGCMSYIAEDGNVLITKREDTGVADFYNQNIFSYHIADIDKVLKSTFNGVNGKISSNLATFNESYKELISLNSFVEAQDEPFYKLTNDIDTIVDTIVNELNSKVESYTGMGRLPAETNFFRACNTIEQHIESITNVLAETGSKFVPIFSNEPNSYNSILMVDTSKNEVNLEDLKFCENQFFTRNGYWQDYKSTPLLRTGKLQYSKLFLTAVGNFIVAHLLDLERTDPVFQQILPSVAYWNQDDNLYLEVTYYQGDDKVVKCLLDRDFLLYLYKLLETQRNSTGEVPSYITSPASLLEYKNWKKDFALDYICRAIEHLDTVGKLFLDSTENTKVKFTFKYYATGLVTAPNLSNNGGNFEKADYYNPEQTYEEANGLWADAGYDNWEGVHSYSHSGKISFTDTLKNLSVLELQVRSIDYLLGEDGLIAPLLSPKLKEFTNDSVAKIKTFFERIDTAEVVLGKLPIDSDSLGNIFYKETSKNNTIYELSSYKCEFCSNQTVRIREDILSDLRERGQISAVIIDNFANRYFTNVVGSRIENDYLYIDVNPECELSELPNNEGLILLDFNHNVNIEQNALEELAEPRTLASKKIFKDSQNIIFSFEWNPLSQENLNYLTTNLYSQYLSMYDQDSSLGKITKIPQSLMEFENLTIVDLNDYNKDSMNLVFSLIEENKSLYLDSSMKIHRHVPLSFGNLVNNDTYDTISYMGKESTPVSISYYNINESAYDPLANMLDFLKDPNKTEYDYESLVSFYNRRHIVWGDVVWDGNQLSKEDEVSKLRTIWSGYLANFEIYSTDDCLPDEYIAKFLSSGTYSQNLMNYNFSANNGTPETNWNITLTASLNNTSTESVKILSNEIIALQNPICKPKAAEYKYLDNFTAEHYVNGFKFRINEESESTEELTYKEYNIGLFCIKSDAGETPLRFKDVPLNESTITPTWAESISKGTYLTTTSTEAYVKFFSIYNYIFTVESLKSSKMFVDRLDNDVLAELLLEWCIYRIFKNDISSLELVSGAGLPSMSEGGETAYYNLRMSTLKERVIQECSRNDRIPCIPVLKDNSAVEVYYFRWNSTLNQMQISSFQIGFSSFAFEGLLIDEVSGEHYPSVPAFTKEDFTILSNSIQRYQASIPASSFKASFNNVDLVRVDNDRMTYEDDEAYTSLSPEEKIEHPELHSDLPILNVDKQIVTLQDYDNSLPISIGDKSYHLGIKRKYFKEYLTSNMDLSVKTTTTIGANRDDCFLAFDNKNLNLIDGKGYLYLYDMKVPNTRTHYSDSKEIQIVDRYYRLNNLRAIAVKNTAIANRKEIYLKDDPSSNLNIARSIPILTPEDSTKHTQEIRDGKISVGKMWKPITEDIGYSFYKRRFITDGKMSSNAGNIVRVDKTLLKEIKLTDHIQSGDLITILLHKTPYFYSKPGNHYIMNFEDLEEFKGPFRIISETPVGNSDQVVIAGKNGVFGLNIFTGEKSDFEASGLSSWITICSKWQGAGYSNFGFYTAGEFVVLCAQDLSGNQKAFKGNGTWVSPEKFFDNSGVVESMSPEDLALSLPEFIFEPTSFQSLTTSHADWNTSSPLDLHGKLLGSLPLPNDQVLWEDSFDRFFFVTGSGAITPSRHPADFELVDASDTLNSIILEKGTSLEIKPLKACSAEQLKNFCLERVRDLLGVTEENDYTYTFKTELGNQFEKNIKDKFAQIVLGTSEGSVIVDLDHVYLPKYAEMDIPYLQVPEKGKCKWKKENVIIGTYAYTLQEENGVGENSRLYKFANLLKNSWYRTRKDPKFTTWAKYADNYVIWDEENATLSIFNAAGSLVKQIALGLIGYHTPASMEIQEPTTCDYHKGIYLNLPELKDIYNDTTIGIRPSDEIHILIEGESTPINIYDLFTNPDYPLYYPDMREGIDETEYLKYWNYCRQLNSFAPSTLNHPAFRKPISTGGVDDYSYAAIEAWIEEQTDLEENVKDALTKVKEFLQKNSINDKFLKGVPYYDITQAEIYQNLTQFVDTFPMAFHSLVKDSNIVVTGKTINIYGKLEFPSLTEIRNGVVDGLTRVYGAQYPNRGSGTTSEDRDTSDEVLWVEKGIDGIIEAEADNTVDEIKRIYSSFYPGAINEEDDQFAKDRTFMISVDLDTGVVTPQPLDSEDLVLDAVVSTDGDTLTAVTQKGLIEMGYSDSNQLSTLITSPGNVQLIDASVYDALKNSKFISHKVSLITVGDSSKLSVEALGEIQHMSDRYVSTVQQINGDSIYLRYSILPEMIKDPDMDVTIMVDDTNHNNFQGLFYTNEMDPSWILSKINPDQTLFAVEGKDQADFATFENAKSRRIIPDETNQLERMTSPCVFQMKEPRNGITLTAEELLSVGMYPQYKDIAEDYRKYFYNEDEEGNLQYLKNRYNNYIFRLTDMTRMDSGSIYNNPSDDPTKIENNIITAGISIPNLYEQKYPLYDELIEGNIFKCQRIPALTNMPNQAVKDYPYKSDEYTISGEAIIKDGYIVLDVTGVGGILNEPIKQSSLNGNLLTNLVTDKYIAELKTIADDVSLHLSKRELLYGIIANLGNRELYPDLNSIKTYVNSLDGDSVAGLSAIKSNLLTDCDTYLGLVLLEDYTNIDEIVLKVINKTPELPILRPITDFSTGEFGQDMKIDTENDEMIIPQEGYGQTIQGTYTTPRNCAFEDGTFFDQSHFTINRSGRHFKLVEESEDGDYTIKEADVPKLMYNSFSTAEAALPMNLSTSEFRNWQPVLLNLKDYKVQSDGSLMFNDEGAIPDFLGNKDKLKNYNLFKDQMKTNCKILYSENGLDESVNGDVIQSTFQGESYSIVKGLVDMEKVGFVDNKEVYDTDELLDKIGYTRVYLKSDAIPNAIQYKNTQEQYATTNTPYRALADKWAATEEGKLLKIAPDGSITSNPNLGSSKFINAIDVNSLLESFKSLQNVFSTFEVDKNGINSFYNLSKLLEISDKYLYSNYTKRVIELKEKGNQKTFLFKVDPKNTINLLLYDTLEYLDRNRKDLFTVAINDNTLTLTFDATYKTYNMAYLKDKDGDCVAKIFFKTPLNAGYITTYSKL